MEGILVRARDSAGAGLTPWQLRRLVQQGRLERVSRGVYVQVAGPGCQHESLSVSALRAPGTVVCLLSALHFHNLGTQNPTRLWLAYSRKRARPILRDLPAELVCMQPELMEVGVESRWLDGVEVRITNPARTVLDCLRLRRLVGLDVALEALREYVQLGLDLQELRTLASRLRVAGLLAPYLEALS